MIITTKKEWTACQSKPGNGSGYWVGFLNLTLNYDDIFTLSYSSRGINKQPNPGYRKDLGFYELPGVPGGMFRPLKLFSFGG